MTMTLKESIIRHKRIIPIVVTLVAITAYMVSSQTVSQHMVAYGTMNTREIVGGNGGIGGAGGAGGVGGNGGENINAHNGGNGVHQSANGGPANGGNGGSANGGNACINAGCNSGSFRHP